MQNHPDGTVPLLVFAGRLSDASASASGKRPLSGKAPLSLQVERSPPRPVNVRQASENPSPDGADAQLHSPEGNGASERPEGEKLKEKNQSLAETAARHIERDHAMQIYRMPTTREAGDRYISPPPTGESAEGIERHLGKDAGAKVAAVGEIWSLGSERDEHWIATWAFRFPASAEVYDGVHPTEAGVIEIDGEPTGHEVMS